MARQQSKIKFEGTINEWLNKISHEPKIYMKKPKGRSVYVWHEKGDDWFNNVATKGKTSSRYYRQLVDSKEQNH